MHHLLLEYKFEIICPNFPRSINTLNPQPGEDLKCCSLLIADHPRRTEREIITITYITDQKLDIHCTLETTRITKKTYLELWLPREQGLALLSPWQLFSRSH